MTCKICGESFTSEEEKNECCPYCGSSETYLDELDFKEDWTTIETDDDKF